MRFAPTAWGAIFLTQRLPLLLPPLKELGVFWEPKRVPSLLSTSLVTGSKSCWMSLQLRWQMLGIPRSYLQHLCLCIRGFLWPVECVWPQCGAGWKCREFMPPGASLSRGGTGGGASVCPQGGHSAMCSARSRGGSSAGPSPVAHGGPVPPVTPSSWASLPSLPQLSPLSYFPGPPPKYTACTPKPLSGSDLGGAQMKTGMKVIIDRITLSSMHKLYEHTVTKLKDLLMEYYTNLNDSYHLLYCSAYCMLALCRVYFI